MSTASNGSGARPRPAIEVVGLAKTYPGGVEDRSSAAGCRTTGTALIGAGRTRPDRIQIEQARDLAGRLPALG